ncbi:MAG: tRNA (guanine(37)-N1)-methyltransferase Trm5b [Candidatus Thorarchaeota archaeon AB_25]|nr:MAG: tRNA (guanine(37)-N1)-methyltransferase Trm5b [Candidatus Thorarchaeota archaeon AB_25]
MSSKKVFLKVAVRDGERTRKALLEHNLLDIDFKILSQDGALFIPLRHEVKSELIDTILGSNHYETGEMDFESIFHGPKNLSEALEIYLSPEELELVPRAYDLIGDIAVLEIPDELSSHREMIGRVFHEVHKNFSTVLAKKGAISGTTRVREYQCLAGEDKTETIHIEYGCRLAVDLSKAYFSPRLLEEHNRIAQLVKDNEFVVDMFCGVGPFPIHIARHGNAHIVAIDINPDAIALLKKSIGLNKLVGTVEPIVGNAKDYSKSKIADRVIMNHPSGAFDFVPDACRILKPQGVLHYYDFVGGENPEDTVTNKLTQLVDEAGRTVEMVCLVRRVRDSAPYEFQMVVDAIIS